MGDEVKMRPLGGPWVSLSEKEDSDVTHIGDASAQKRDHVRTEQESCCL